MSRVKRRRTSLIYWGLWVILRILFKIIWRNQIIGYGNVPKTGGVIFAPNHISNLDPPYIACCSKRAGFAMGKKELFKNPIFAYFLRNKFNTIPIKRSEQDIKALRYILDLLKSGEMVGIFPEGTRSKDGNIGKARPGIGMIACNAQVPVIPVRLVNTDKLLKFKPLKITFGKPLLPPKIFEKDDYKKFADSIVEEIKKL
ncbi:lysophospholipid acyltransferase family protein [Elusimicrobiota bacterium]